MTTVQQPPDAGSGDLSPRISRTLSKLRGRIRRYVSLDGLALAVAWLGLAFWISLAVDWVPVTFGYDELSMTSRIGVLVATGVVLAGILFWFVARRLAASMPNRSMAVLLERRFAEYDDALLTTVEMTDAPDHAASFNPDMLRHTSEEALGHTDHVKLSHVFNPWPLVRNVLLAVVFVGSIAGFAAARADAFEIWMKRFLMLDSSQLWPRKNFVTVDGQWPKKAASGDDITVVVQAHGKDHELPGSVRIEYDSVDGSGRRSMKQIRQVIDGKQEYRHTFEGLSEGSVYFEVVGGDYRVRGEQYRIDVVPSPSAELVLDVVFPAYTEMTRDTRKGSAVKVPRGSRVTVVGLSNKPLSEVKVDISYGEGTSKPPLRDEAVVSTETITPRPTADDLNPEPVPAGMRFTYVIDPLMDAQDLQFSLVDTDDLRNTRDPVVISIEAIEDKVPEVEAHLAGVGEAVTPQVRIPFRGKIIDEYGVDNVVFEYTRTGQESIELPFNQKPLGRGGSQEFTFPARVPPGGPLVEEAIDFQLLPFQMRKKRGDTVTFGEGEKPPKEAPGEAKKAAGKKKDAADEDASDEDELDEDADGAKKPDDGKKPADGPGDDESAKYQLTPGQTFNLQVVARDRCNLDRPENRGVSSLFAFRVVTPDELRAILAARELTHRKRFEQIRDEMLVTRDSLANISFKISPLPPPRKAPGAKAKDDGKDAGAKEPGAKEPEAEAETPRVLTAEDQRLDAFLRSQRAQQNGAKNSIEVLEVARNFDIIREELINNRLYNEELNKRIKLGISDPLYEIGGTMFQDFDEILNELVARCDKDFDNTPAREESVRQAVEQSDAIIVRMNSVLDKMEEFESFNEAIRLLREIIKLQDDVNDKTKKARADEFKSKLFD